jgi:polysaccharide export outer membrane protein
MKINHSHLPLLLGLLMLSIGSGCRVYNQNILFSTKETIISGKPAIEAEIRKAEKNYIIQKNDYIEIQLFSDTGSFLIEPIVPTDPTSTNPAGNQRLNQNMTGGQFGIQNQQLQQGGGMGNQFPLSSPIFLVEQNGQVNFPKIGWTMLENLTLSEADSLLSAKYEKYYKGCYVRTRYTNKRVVVFKGSAGVIYPLRNEKVNLIEVLAQTGGFPENLRGSNIRLIRGDLKDPTVYLINLRTIEGLRQYDLTIEPNDIIYVEPIRKTFLEVIKDLSPVISAITSILTLTVTIILLRR